MKSTFIPLYLRIFNDLKIQIQTGKLKPGDKLPTEFELMEIYNVSRITASKAVSRLAEENYVERNRKLGSFVKPINDSHSNDLLLSPVETNTPNIFPLIFPFSMNNGLNIIDGVNRFDKVTYYYVPYNSDNSVENERKILTDLLKINPPGLICHPIVSKKNISYFMQFLSKRIPLVFIDHGVYGINAPCVTTDNFNVAYQLTQKLIEYGHTDIAFVATNMNLETIETRFSGHISALAENNIIPNDDFHINLMSEIPSHDILVTSDPEIFDLPNKFNKLMSLKNRPTAIICGNDATAIHIERLAIDAGIQVPDELSIIGFDNLDFCSCATVPITSVAQDYLKLGEEAISIFNNLRMGLSVPMKSFVPAKIIWRDSVKSFTNKEPY